MSRRADRPDRRARARYTQSVTDGSTPRGAGDGAADAAEDADRGKLYAAHEALLRVLAEASDPSGDAASLRASGELLGSLARLVAELRLRVEWEVGRLLEEWPDAGGRVESPARGLRQGLGIDRSSAHRFRAFANAVSSDELESIVDQIWDADCWPPNWGAVACAKAMMANPPPSDASGD